MRVTQGTFSFLPDLTDDEIKAQIQYAYDNGWALSVEYTDDPHPRNAYWEMWGLPNFDLEDPSAVLYEVNECRRAFPNQYIKVTAYDSRACRQTTAFDMIVNRPPAEPGFFLERTEANDRHIHYTLRSYAAFMPHGDRYGADGSGKSDAPGRATAGEKAFGDGGDA